MKSAYVFVVLWFLSCIFSDVAFSQSLLQTAKKEEQKIRDLKQQETLRYNEILDSRDINKYKQFIADYPQGITTSEIKNRIKEIELWDNAKLENTILSYESYLSRTHYHWYDNEANKSINSIKKFLEREKWEKVKAENTISAYRGYLRDNPQGGYRAEAEHAIIKLESFQDWEQIKNRNSIHDLESFIQKYPEASEISAATDKLHELKGREYYDDGNLQAAYSEFSHLKKSQISYFNRQAYDETLEYHDFSLLKPNSPQTYLQSFLNKYPNGKYACKVSNMLAISKAYNFGYEATNYEYNQALSYAKDAATIELVKSYISKNKKLQKQRNSYYKNRERKLNGGLFNLGLEFFDFGYNWNSENRSILYYNIGLLLRIGNYKDRIQFALGIKPGIIGYDDVYYDYFSWSYSYFEKTQWETGFHMPIVGQFKLNLFNTSQDSRFFVYGQFQYNAVRQDVIESEMSWAVGLGVAWKHIDLSLYYSRDLTAPKNWEYGIQHYVAMSIAYYWSL